MELNFEKSASWSSKDFVDATADPNISISTMTEAMPTLTVTTILAVTVVVIIAIAVVFVLGVLIDCRQQRILDKKINEVRRRKNFRRVKSQPQGDVISIVNNMEEPGLSMTPAEVLRNVP